jgi:hypothetical protein
MQTFAHVVRKVLQSSAADDTDLQIQNALLNFSDPCKPVLSAVRFCLAIRALSAPISG